MVNIDLNKYKISIEDYSYEEFQKNRYVLESKWNFWLILSTILFSIFAWYFYHISFFVALAINFILCFIAVTAFYDLEYKNLNNRYFLGAKREWVTCKKIEIAPIFKCPVDEKRLGNPAYVDLLNGCRRDVRIKDGKVEYYVILSDGKLDRKTNRVDCVFFDVSSGDLSFYIRERRVFVDVRFNEFFKKRESDILDNFRTVIQSKYIQW